MAMGIIIRGDLRALEDCELSWVPRLSKLATSTNWYGRETTMSKKYWFYFN